jgi:hypothetical protein
VDRPEDREYLAIANPHRPLRQRLEVVTGLAQAGPNEKVFEIIDSNLPSRKRAIVGFVPGESASCVAGLAQDPGRFRLDETSPQ